MKRPVLLSIMLLLCSNLSAQILSLLDFDFGQGVRNEDWVQAVRVSHPECRSCVSGEV